tara:strand:- start:347 stop:460 length:114 start_codon:yes stop_codon:yes gene_type:complete
VVAVVVYIQALTEDQEVQVVAEVDLMALRVDQVIHLL